MKMNINKIDCKLELQILAVVVLGVSALMLTVGLMRHFNPEFVYTLSGIEYSITNKILAIFPK